MSEDLASEDLVPIGAVIKPHGLQGELRVHPFNEKSPIWKGLKKAWLDGEDVPRKVLRSRRAAKHAIVAFEGVKDRTQAEALRGREVRVPRAELPALAEDEYYLTDLIGMKVRRGEEVLGEIEGIFEYPSCVCLKVRCADGVRELPILEPWFERIDHEAGEVWVGPWDDLPVET